MVDDFLLRNKRVNLLFFKKWSTIAKVEKENGILRDVKVCNL
jgi:hypothetical protein